MVCNRKKNKVTKTTCTYFGDKSQKFAPTAKKKQLYDTQKKSLHLDLNIHSIFRLRCTRSTSYGQQHVQNFLHMVRYLPRYDPAQMSQTSMFLSVRDLTSVPVPLTQSGVNKAINSLWQEVHGRGSKVSTTMLRKLVMRNPCKAVKPFGLRRPCNSYESQGVNSRQVLQPV